MRRSVTLAILLLAARSAIAERIDGELTTLVSGRPDPRDGEIHTTIPIYGLAWLRADDLANPLFDDLTLVVSGWGRLDASDADGDADLDVGYLEGRLLRKRLQLRVGRQIVAGGAARVLPLDGASLLVTPLPRVRLETFGGAPVTPRFGVDRGDAAVGARASYRRSFGTEAGVSFVHVLDDGVAARTDAGIDGRAILGRATAGASAIWSLAELRLAEAQLWLALRPARSVRVELDARRTAPDLFLPRGSIFTVFSEETRDELGGSLELRPVGAVRLRGGYHLLSLEAGTGHAATVELAHRVAGFELRALRLPADGYLRGRLWWTARASECVALFANLDGTMLDRPQNGETTSFAAAATVTWEVAKDWRFAASGVAGWTPTFERRFELWARLVWRFALGERR